MTADITPEVLYSYQEYPEVEERFDAALDVSLAPRGPSMLYDLVERFGPAPGDHAADVGCGEGRHSLVLAERFGLRVTGVDPVPRQVERAGATAASHPDPAVRSRVRFALGSAEWLPVDDGSVDLVWCRDVMVHVPDLDRAFREFRRVLGPGGRVMVYQMVATDRLEPREREWLFSTTGVQPASADPDAVAAAIGRAGLRITERIDLGTEWGEFAQEESGKPGRLLLHAARLIRGRDRYVAEFGPLACDAAMADALWHVYAMIGKLSRLAYCLEK